MRPDGKKLAIVMVGLPARGKSYTARRIERYLAWLGYATRVFNVGEYRRRDVGADVRHDFFNPDNAQGGLARMQVAMRALDDMLGWLEREGDVAVYDATNSTVARRALVRERCEQRGLSVMFFEVSCDDPAIIDANIRGSKLASPDYQNVPREEALADFRARIAHYERVYQPLGHDEGAYLRVEESGQTVSAHHIDGYLASRLVFFVMNLHRVDRPILLTRHGESEYNTRGLLGGDASLTALGERYARALAEHLRGQLPGPNDLVVWTSSLARAVQTAAPMQRDASSWRALDEIDAGVCEGMTYEQIRHQLPDEFAARKADKLHYRYPRGESYEDVIKRLDPVIIELERTRKPVLVIAHNAVIRALYAYFVGVPREQCPHIEIPLHTLLELRTHAYGCQEARHALL